MPHKTSLDTSDGGSGSPPGDVIARDGPAVSDGAAPPAADVHLPSDADPVDDSGPARASGEAQPDRAEPITLAEQAAYLASIGRPVDDVMLVLRRGWPFDDQDG